MEGIDGKYHLLYGNQLRTLIELELLLLRPLMCDLPYVEVFS